MGHCGSVVGPEADHYGNQLAAHFEIEMADRDRSGSEAGDLGTGEGRLQIAVGSLADQKTGNAGAHRMADYWDIGAYLEGQSLVAAAAAAVGKEAVAEEVEIEVAVVVAGMERVASQGDDRMVEFVEQRLDYQVVQKTDSAAGESLETRLQPGKESA